MLDFTPVRNKQTTMGRLAEGLTPGDLRRLTNEMVDTMLGLIADCTDADVTFAPDDPEARDDAASTEDEVNIAWTLGHVIVHTTASAEEAAFLAAELARGVERPGRSRYEVHWTTITTIAQCRHWLEESRRMRQALLNAWPDQPHLDLLYTPAYAGAAPLNAIARFAGGLSHDDAHLGQLREIMRQARAARVAA
ncbi:MAG: DinB family protein [Chloroflexota bacterium]